MRILVAVPTYPSEPAVKAMTKRSVQAMLRASRHDVTLTYLTGEGQPQRPHYEDLLCKHQQARRRALEQGFDALMLVEADMVVRPDCLDRLAALVESGAADIAYSLYVSRSTRMWLLFDEVERTGGKSILVWPQRARAAWGQVVASEGAGLGATLIGRDALARLDFRLDEGTAFADDWAFALDAKRLGLRQVHDCGCPSGHIIAEAEGQTTVAWPHVDEAGQPGSRVEVMGRRRERKPMRYRVLKPLTGPNGTRMPGEEAVFSGEEAAVLERRGCIERIVESKPQAETEEVGAKAKEKGS